MLIQITPDSAFLSWPQMSMARAGNKILFGFACNGNPTIAQFDCTNDSVAVECYKHLMDCFADNDVNECDLALRHDKLVKCWEIAPRLVPAILAMRDANMADLSFAEIKPFKDALEAIDPNHDYANHDGKTLYLYGTIAFKFHAIQTQGQ